MAKALIAMSGGVDSSVAAYLAIKQGFSCVGATLILLDGHDKNISDAAAVCEKLGIPFYSFDLREEFKSCVIEDFVSSFENGETPNPCVLCNKHFKFGALFEKAQELGCDTIITGHYAKISNFDGTARLQKGENKAKDQSYFLYSLPREILPHVYFPLGSYSKDEIRKIAEEQGFITAKKKDSQDICFVPNGDYASVILNHTGKNYPTGAFIDTKGNKIGEHSGIINYTIGQRKGLGVAFGKPMYVGNKNAQLNEITLCEDAELYKSTLTARDFNCLVPSLDNVTRCKVKIRYRHEEQPAEVTINGKNIEVKFDTPQRAITPGQSVVLYDGDTVLGGAIIN